LERRIVERRRRDVRPEQHFRSSAQSSTNFIVAEKKYGQVKGPYTQTSARGRIEALFLDNVGKVITAEQIRQVVGKNRRTGEDYENWHQRLSELRTDSGYTILTKRDRHDLKVSEYLLQSAKKRPNAAKRTRPTPVTWARVLKSAGNACQWFEGGSKCGLKEGEIDPVGGGTVRLTPDHKTPHSVNPTSNCQMLWIGRP